MALDPQNPGASRLNHLGSLYTGAIAEVGRGEAVSFIPHGAPGVQAVRSMLQKTLFARAELNAFAAILIEKGLTTAEELGQRIDDECHWLADREAESFSRMLGVRVTATNEGLRIEREGATPP